jgi:hypothetical protein
MPIYTFRKLVGIRKIREPVALDALANPARCNAAPAIEIRKVAVGNLAPPDPIA